MRLALCHLIWNFDLSLVEGQPEPEYCHITISAGKLLVRVQKREV